MIRFLWWLFWDGTPFVTVSLPADRMATLRVRLNIPDDALVVSASVNLMFVVAAHLDTGGDVVLRDPGGNETLVRFTPERASG